MLYCNCQFSVVNLKYGLDDYLGDHMAVSELVFLASFTETVLHYELQQGETYQVLSIYYIEYFKLLRYEPEEYLDISE